MSVQPDLFAQGEESHLRHQNHFLFSDYYLEQLLPSEDVWRDERESAADLLTWIQATYNPTLKISDANGICVLKRNE